MTHLMRSVMGEVDDNGYFNHPGLSLAKGDSGLRRVFPGTMKQLGNRWLHP
jgi:hypothetical protein